MVNFSCIFSGKQKEEILALKHFRLFKKIDYLVIKVVVDQKYSKKTELFIQDLIHSRFDLKAKVELVKVEKIEREKSGKMRVVVGMH